MKKEITYCDNCGEPLQGNQWKCFLELPYDVASANAGESAIVCSKCDKVCAREYRRDYILDHLYETIKSKKRHIPS